MVGKTWLLELEAAGHIVSVIRKHKELSSAIGFYFMGPSL